MKREQIKVPRGTARRLRRADMAIFKVEREKRIARQKQVHITVSVSSGAGKGRAVERNPHAHSVATVTDMGNGDYVVRQYEWTTTYPANVPSPCRQEIAAPRHFSTYGAAKEVADLINHIAVPEMRSLAHLKLAA